MLSKCIIRIKCLPSILGIDSICEFDEDCLPNDAVCAYDYEGCQSGSCQCSADYTSSPHDNMLCEKGKITGKNLLRQHVRIWFDSSSASVLFNTYSLHILYIKRESFWIVNCSQYKTASKQ